ncbi:hypothetical protein SK128_025244 [Halocaridina rubra]|uniref:Uncharacterized protein n=1 Tax=Halocaridina rubra TaxID=373956 RepID=A0AAN8ZYX4_HALRR
MASEGDGLKRGWTDGEIEADAKFDEYGFEEQDQSLIGICDSVDLNWLPAVFGLISASTMSVCGYVTSEDDLETVFRCHEIYTQCPFHRDGDDQNKRQSRPRRLFYGSRLLELSSHLTSNDRCRVYLCKHGMRLRGSKVNKSDEVSAFKNAECSSASSTKCPARIYVNEVAVYSDYEISGLTMKEKQDKMNGLKRDIVEKPDSLNIDKYYHIRLPLKSAHSVHKFELRMQSCKADVNIVRTLFQQANIKMPSKPTTSSPDEKNCKEPVLDFVAATGEHGHTKGVPTACPSRHGKAHPLVIKKIQELAEGGITSARAQKIILRDFVRQMFSDGIIEDDKPPSYYFPTESTIFNKIKSILYKTKGKRKQFLSQKLSPLNREAEEPILRIYITTSCTPNAAYSSGPHIESPATE